MIRIFPKIAGIKELKMLLQYQAKEPYLLQYDSHGEPVYAEGADQAPLPTIDFMGTVKLHGTNASLRMDKSGEIYYQSRESLLTLNADNYGFCRKMSTIDLKSALFDKIGLDYSEDISIYGEWCGKGIQSNVGICNLDKMFVVFAVAVDGKFIELSENIKSEENRIFNVLQFPTYRYTIDFNDSEKIAQVSRQINEQVASIEKQCPVAAYFGVDGTGEGMVVSRVFNGQLYIFKVKGEEHKVSKTDTINKDQTKLAIIEDFINKSLTENRLEQGFLYMKTELRLEYTKPNVAHFINWCKKDVLTEEALTMTELGLVEKDVATGLSNVARKFYFNKIESL